MMNSESDEATKGEIISAAKAVVKPAPHDVTMAGIVAPIMDIDALVEQIKRFDDFKQRVLAPDDYLMIQGKQFIRKSGLMKYALACGLSLERVEESRVYDEKKDRVTYHFMYRAVAPNGRFAEAVGSATSDEKGKLSEHYTRALAQTRASNRAVSNLVASGQVSAEEVGHDDNEGSTAEREYRKESAKASESCDKCTVSAGAHPKAVDGTPLIDKYCAYNPDQVWRLKVDALLKQKGLNPEDFKKHWLSNDQQKARVKG